MESRQEGVDQEGLGCFHTTFTQASVSLVGCLASRHTLPRPETHVQPRIMATHGPRGLSKLDAWSGPLLPPTPPPVGHRGRTDPA
jgi:hypothetical protein